MVSRVGRDRHDTRAAQAACGRFQSDQGIGARRREYRTGSLRAHCRNGIFGSNRGAAAGTRTTGSEDQPAIRIERLAAHGAPAGRAIATKEICPFAEIGLAENDRAALKHSLGYESVIGLVVRQGKCAGGGRQASHADIVLEQNRHAENRIVVFVMPAVSLPRLFESQGIQRNHRVQKSRRIVFSLANSIKIEPGQGLVTQFAVVHSLLQLID